MRLRRCAALWTPSAAKCVIHSRQCSTTNTCEMGRGKVKSPSCCGYLSMNCSNRIDHLWPWRTSEQKSNHAGQIMFMSFHLCFSMETNFKKMLNSHNGVFILFLAFDYSGLPSEGQLGWLWSFKQKIAMGRYKTKIYKTAKFILKNITDIDWTHSHMSDTELQQIWKCKKTKKYLQLREKSHNVWFLFKK